MRNPDEQQLALECLKLACAYLHSIEGAPIDNAARMLAFVTGEENDAAVAKLADVRKAVG